MTTEPLFIDAQLSFDKTAAAEVTLPEDPNAWGGEIIQEVYKQVPYVADFDPETVMTQVDGQRAFGFGYVLVSNKTELSQDAPQQTREAAGVKHVRIPIIIRDNKLQPFDLLITEDGKVLPLTEMRLREALFRPQTFDMTSRTPGDTSLMSQLYPPFRQNYGGAAGVTVPADMGKMGSHDFDAFARDLHSGKFAIDSPGGDHGIREGDVIHGGNKHFTVSSAMIQGHDPKQHGPREKGPRYWNLGGGEEKKASLLDAVLETVTPHDHAAFLAEVADPMLQAAFTKNAHAVTGAFEAILAAEPVSLAKHASVFAHLLEPSVAQIAKHPEGGYLLKTASHHMWSPIVQHVDRGDLLRRFGDKVVLAADLSGGVTVANDANESEEEQGTPPEPIKDFGIYRVQDESGRDLIGYVFPNLIDIDGTKLPMALFTNGSQSAVQGEIVGTRVGDAVPVQEGRPKGNGVFFTMDEGEAEATLPLTVNNTFSMPEEGGAEVSLMGETMDGRPIQIQQQPNIQKLMFVDDVLLVPAHYRWLSLEGSEPVVLVSSPDDVGKVAHVQAMARTVVIRGDDNSFSIDGLPVEKIGEDQRHFVSSDGALFLLAGLGVDMTYAQRKIASASTGRAPVEVRVGRFIETAVDQEREAIKIAAERLDQIPDLRRVLVKEAAVIPDPVAVDTVLSLGFINPENIASIIKSMPKIEEGQRRMCELLLAARLGIKEIPVYALERAVHATEEVLDGLKVLAFQKN